VPRPGESARSPRFRRRLVYVALVLLVGGGCAAGQRIGVLSGLQVASADLLFRTRSPRPARATVILGIDERTYRALRPAHGPLSHWPRSVYADALARLWVAGAPSAAGTPRTFGPRAVAFEIFFDGTRPGDTALAEAMRRVGNVVTPVIAEGPLDFDPRPGVAQRFEVFVRTADEIRSAAAGEGLVNVTVARDGVVRGVPLVLRSGGEELPALPLAVAALYARRPQVIDGGPQAGQVHAAGRLIPVGEADTMAINYLGPPSAPGGIGPVPIIPLVDVLEGRFDPALAHDRVVLIGVTIRGVDELATPTSTNTRMWGVEVLAHAVETIVFQQFLRPVPAAVTSAAIALLAILGGALGRTRRVALASGALLLAVGAYVTIAAMLFEAGAVLDVLYAPAALVLSFGATLVYRLVFVQAENRLVRQALGRYLSPAVSRWALRDPRRLALSGEARETTLLFNDLRGFTAQAHALPPETLVALLNRYRARMTEVVFAHDGVLVQYSGDAIEAFWNAPLPQLDHAARACRAALDMTAVLDELRGEFARAGWADLDAGVGVNTGRVIVGNMGSASRLTYTAVGDPVNVAARLEGLTKLFGVRIVLGEETRRQVGAAFVCRELDRVAVVGRAEPVTAFELVGAPAQVDAARRRQLDRFHAALELYRARRRDEAAETLVELEREDPGDKPTGVLLRRCRALAKTPPPDDWDGVYVALTK
jgi:adenylate cyclase